MTARQGTRRDAVSAARACVGTPFRAQGRMIGIGLDCVGVVLLAAARVCRARVDACRGHLPAYRLGGEHGDCLLVALDMLGCVPTAQPMAGDVLVMAPRPALRHVGILTPVGIVHAHAGLGRVVEGPICEDWAWVGHWRLPGVE